MEDDMKTMTDAQLLDCQTRGAAVYMAAYLHRMSRMLEVPIEDDEEIHRMIIKMVRPLNHATTIIWCGMMHDTTMLKDSMEAFIGSLKQL